MNISVHEYILSNADVTPEGKTYLSAFYTFNIVSKMSMSFKHKML
jgi:hypothetical protein